MLSDVQRHSPSTYDKAVSVRMEKSEFMIIHDGRVVRSYRSEIFGQVRSVGEPAPALTNAMLF